MILQSKFYLDNNVNILQLNYFFFFYIYLKNKKKFTIEFFKLSS